MGCFYINIEVLPGFAYTIGLVTTGRSRLMKADLL